jgi:prevent-host-death family protein
MKEIGIRELKARASEVVRRVAEQGECYTITRRGRPVGILAARDHVAPAARVPDGRAWDRLLATADRISARGGTSSAVRELARTRR